MTILGGLPKSTTEISCLELQGKVSRHGIVLNNKTNLYPFLSSLSKVVLIVCFINSQMAQKKVPYPVRTGIFPSSLKYEFHTLVFSSIVSFYVPKCCTINTSTKFLKCFQKLNKIKSTIKMCIFQTFEQYVKKKPICFGDVSMLLKSINNPHIR